MIATMWVDGMGWCRKWISTLLDLPSATPSLPTPSLSYALTTSDPTIKIHLDDRIDGGEGVLLPKHEPEDEEVSPEEKLFCFPDEDEPASEPVLAPSSPPPPTRYRNTSRSDRRTTEQRAKSMLMQMLQQQLAGQQLAAQLKKLRGISS